MKQQPVECLDKWERQVKKGILDFVILLCLNRQELYGYEMIKSIKRIADLDISEGTIYPLLNRLTKRELVHHKWIERDAGVPRKYYTITEKGRIAMKKMLLSWGQLNKSINQLYRDPS